MAIELEIVVDKAVTDTPCDNCGRVINEGEEFFYDQNTDHMYCADCADREFNIRIE